MSVTINFNCNGCFEETKGTKSIDRTFNSFNGKGYGFGTWSLDAIQDVAPKGWIAHDPYTGCCYCPECWASIEAHEEETA